jgi:hypothetical protein
MDESSHSRLVDEQKRLYAQNFRVRGDTPQGTFQNDRVSQYLRYDRLMAQIMRFAKNPSIHDVGSGTCDLHTYLLGMGFSHRYSGTEIVDEMIEVSRTKYPAVKIYKRDLLNDPFDDCYDWVVLSGTLNLQVGKGESWKDYCYKLIERMFVKAVQGISFNFLTTYNTFAKPALFYMNPVEAFHFCMTKLSRFVVLDHGYPLYESTISVFKPHFMKECYQDPLLEKYFMKIRQIPQPIPGQESLQC